MREKIWNYSFIPRVFLVRKVFPSTCHLDMCLWDIGLGTPSAPSLYHNPILASGVRPRSDLFITNTTSQPTITSVPVQPTIPNTLVSSIWVTRQSQLVVSKIVSGNSSVPLFSGQIVPPLGGQNLNASMVSGATNVSGSQAHMISINKPSSGIIYNPTDPIGSRNV